MRAPVHARNGCAPVDDEPFLLAQLLADATELRVISVDESMLLVERIDTHIELLRIKGKLSEIKVGCLKVGGEALKVERPAIGPNNGVPILDPAVALLVKDGELGPVDPPVCQGFGKLVSGKDLLVAIAGVGAKGQLGILPLHLELGDGAKVLRHLVHAGDLLQFHADLHLDRFLYDQPIGGICLSGQHLGLIHTQQQAIVARRLHSKEANSIVFTALFDAILKGGRALHARQIRSAEGLLAIISQYNNRGEIA